MASQKLGIVLTGVDYVVGKHAVLRLLGLAYRVLKTTPVIRWKLSKRLYYAIYAWAKPTSDTKVMTEGIRLKIDPKDEGVASFLITTGAYEPFEISLLTQITRPGSVVIDIGAKIGHHTVIAADRVGPTGRVFAFEPSPENFGRLLENVELNGFIPRVRARQVAIGEQNLQCELYLSDTNFGDHQIRLAEKSNRQSLPVALRRLDDEIEPGTRADVIKMDVQGAEYLALLGMQRVLNDSPDVTLISEFWPEGIRRCGHEPRLLLNHLWQQGFQLYIINEQQLCLNRLDKAELATCCFCRPTDELDSRSRQQNDELESVD